MKARLLKAALGCTPRATGNARCPARCRQAQRSSCCVPLRACRVVEGNLLSNAWTSCLLRKATPVLGSHR